DRQIDAFSRGIGPRWRQNVLLSQDRACALDQQPGALIAVGDDGLADQDSFIGFEFNLERHVMGLLPLPSKQRWRLREQTPSGEFQWWRTRRRAAASRGIIGTGGAPLGSPARPETTRWSTVAGGSARPAGWRLLRWSRPVSGCPSLPAVC